MASTTALLTGLSGLIANSRRLDVIGNNISNVNTPGYKSTRLLFAPTFSRTIASGTSPSGATGGSNPTQIGLGASIAGTQRNFSNGAIATTGVATDLAIEGKGLFVVDRGGQQLFTRTGAFQLSAQRDLVTATGERVLGFGVDDNFNIVTGAPVSLNVPVGSLTIAEATRNVNLAGNLNAGGLLPTTAGQSLFGQPFLNFVGGVPLTGADLLTSLENPNAAGTALFPAAGVPYNWTLTGVQRGGRTLPDATLTITAATTVQDLLNFVNQATGIVAGLPDPGNPPLGVTGAQIDAAGVVQIVSNTGVANNVIVETQDIRLTDSAGVVIGNPFTLTQPATATGESVHTGFVVYDSLGAEVEIDLTIVFESTIPGGGTTWRYFVDSPDNVSTLLPGLNVATGTISFDGNGRPTTTTPLSVQIGRENTGALDPLVFSMQIASAGNQVRALADATGPSTIAAVFQDGSQLGVLANFSVGSDGVITGAFTNGLTRSLGQIAIATFTNQEGLVDVGNSLYATGPNSGTPLITTPQTFGAGRVVGGALEQANVDLGQEFIDLVLTSTGYSAASRIITTTDQLLQQLIALGR